MGQTSYSSSSFWAKQIGIAAVLVIIAGVLIYMLQTQDQEPVPQGQAEEKSVSRWLNLTNASLSSLRAYPLPA